MLTKEDLEQIGVLINAQFDKRLIPMDEHLSLIRKNVEKLEKRVNSFDKKFDKKLNLVIRYCDKDHLEL